MHASNYLSIRGKLPQAKDRMLRELEMVLAAEDPSLLRPELFRGL
jgi:tryptophan 2,3-dioxygenase